MRNKHQIADCAFCDSLFCVECSDATSLSRKYCSDECRLLDEEGQAVRREDRTGYYNGRTA